MPEVVINRFPGIAPRIRAATPGAVTHAEVAENIDLFGGTARPLMGPSFVEGGHSGTEIFYHGSYPSGTWESGEDNYVALTVDARDMLVYKQGGVWKRRVGAVSNTLGMARPGDPTLLDVSLLQPGVSTVEEVLVGNGLERKEYVYDTTFSKFVSGDEIESAPSAPIGVSPYVIGGTSTDDIVLGLISGEYYPYGAVVMSDTSGSTHAYQATVGFTATGDDAADLAANTVDLGAIVVGSRYHTINRPAASDATATHWNLYRSDDGDTAKLITSGSMTGTGEGYSYISDTKTSVARGRIISSIRGGPLGNEDFRFSYVMTWVRSTAGYEDESGPSDPQAIEVFVPGVKITRPSTYPSGVTLWRIYRISTLYDPTAEYQLVTEQPIADTFYTDANANIELGDVIETSFSNINGTAVNFDEPEVVFDGVAGPHYGMLVGWKGETVYLSEPGHPDAWPHLNKYTAKGAIVAAVSNGSELLIFTKAGVQRMVGTDPEKAYIADVLSDVGAITRQGVVAFKGGVVYLSLAGLMLVAGASVQNLSDPKLGSAFFSGIALGSAFLAYNDGRIFIFHSTGIVIYDLRVSEWVTMSDVYAAAANIAETGLLYVLEDDGSIKSLFTSGDPLTMRYKTGPIVLVRPDRKRFRSFEFWGTGEFESVVYVDGVAVVSGTVVASSGLIRDQSIPTPHGTRGRAAQVSFTGEGEVTEILVEAVKVR